MRVDEFSIGFPPRLYSFRRGDTLYSLNWIPIGGYVKIYGENAGDDAIGAGSFQSRPLFNRIAVMVAGVSMNLIFAFVVLTIAFSVGFTSAVQDAATLPGAHIKSTQIFVAQVLSGSAAEKGGLQANDQITQIKDVATNQTTAITTTSQLQTLTKKIQNQADRRVAVEYSRNNVAGEAETTLAASGPPLGIALASLSIVRFPVWRAAEVSLQEMQQIVVLTWQALKSFAVQLFGHAHLDPNISGPIGIYQATASAAKQGPVSVISLVAILSVNLALLNILPIPALDGGRLLFLVLELIFRRKLVTEHVESALSAAGMVFLLALIAIITIKDLIHIL